ncbi:putative lipoprotein [Candidatus Desulfosporosinus infrequens]|uniref:Putative lipoprotein n=1 Tax=Candidatus Desulfosporosinus infrequens TaxID=2043169 RepID=A0A2U3KGC7_9FIRM|nr:putative lipoprotein [Candidatus Desulfosporosinus infrequens]
MFVLLIVLLCIGAYFHCKQGGCRCNKLVSSHQDALEIVRTRYARGEISSDEFNERRKTLE